MDLARYVVDAVVLEGTELPGGGPGPRRVQELGRQAGRSVPGRWLPGDRAEVPGRQADPPPHLRSARGRDLRAAQGARRARSGRRCGHDRLPPRSAPRNGALGVHDLARAPSAGLRGAPATQAPAELVDPLRGPTARRVLEVRCDPLAPGGSRRRRERVAGGLTIEASCEPSRDRRASRREVGNCAVSRIASASADSASCRLPLEHLDRRGSRSCRVDCVNRVAEIPACRTPTMGGTCR